MRHKAKSALGVYRERYQKALLTEALTRKCYGTLQKPAHPRYKDSCLRKWWLEIEVITLIEW